MNREIDYYHLNLIIFLHILISFNFSIEQGIGKSKNLYLEPLKTQQKLDN